MSPSAPATPGRHPVGSNREVLDWFGTAGGPLKSITIDGRPGSAFTCQQRGHSVFWTLVETPPGGSHTVVLHVREPAGTDPVTPLAQSLIRPLVQTASDDSCS